MLRRLAHWRRFSAATSYDSATIEADWKTRKWLDHHPAPPPPSSSSSPRPFSMVIPPPNVTGRLHIGHALTVAIEDALVRYARIQGQRAVWVPGIDHAGIATQVVVERALAPQSRHDLGRERFVRQVWAWKEQYGDAIAQQLRRMGAALDWERELFTMDPRACAAVTEAFCTLHERGLVYRHSRVVNWCPALQTVISDMETDYRLVSDALMHMVDYGHGVTVATTRPETIPYDVAVAVHSADERYRGITHVTHPLTGARLPVVRDDVLVDPGLGSGAVKITPQHSVADYECAVRCALPLEPPTGTPVVTFANADAAVAALRARGTYAGARRHAMRVPVCSRSGAVLEPRLQPQWYVRCAAMAERAAQWAHLIPERHRGEWRRFLADAPRDWCISRQLWWGHRIPAYRDAATGHWIVSRTPVAGAEQDADVLDTWFSSALFPLVAHGWPGPLDRTLYPLSVMETGADILFFWVARMVMVCSELVPDAGPPFAAVLLHPMVRDAQGRKMSKSLGNVIDPMALIDGADGQPACGADALRFALVDASEAPDSVQLDVAHVRATRALCNKIWHAWRFVEGRTAGDDGDIADDGSVREAPEQWLLHHMAQLEAECAAGVAAGRLHKCTQALRAHLALFCDVYVEWSKTRGPECHRWLRYAMRHFIVQLHPFMPFLTTHLMPGAGAMRTSALPGGPRDPQPMQELLALVSAVRALASPPAAVRVAPSHWDAHVTRHAAALRAQCRVADLCVSPDALPVALPVRGALHVTVPPEVAQNSAAALAATAARAQEKLERLDARWARQDPTRVPEAARRQYEAARALLVAQLKNKD